MLRLVRKQDLSVLILIDEVLMYAREKAGADALKGISEIDEQTKKEGKAAEERCCLKSFLFEPD